MRVPRGHFATATLAGALLSLATWGAAAPPPPPGADEPFLMVSGSGEAHAAPDQATVRFGTQAAATTAQAAQDQVSRTTAAILAALRKGGVPADAIQTSELSLNPTYAPVRNAESPRITGYEAGNSLTVTLDRLDRVGPVVDAGLAAGANRLEGVEFGLRHDSAARAEALTAAVTQARAKAEAFAAALHVQLGELLSATEDGIAPPEPRFTGLRAMAATAMAPTPVAPGQIEVSASVVIRFRVAPCPGQAPCGARP